MSISRILISQPQPSSDKSPFAELIASSDIKVIFRPFIAVEGISVKEFISQRVKILDHTAVIFTSRSLIDNFFRIVGESRVVIPDTMKYFCISESIALYLQKYIIYRKRKIFFADGSLTSLVENVLKHSSERYLVPLSEPHKPEIPLAMERAALVHTNVILSHTRCADLSDVNPADFDIVALYSPAEVKNFRASFLERGYAGKLAVFGQSTARAVLEAGIKVDIMAPQPGLPSMTMALAAFVEAQIEGKATDSFGVNEVEPDDNTELMKMADRRRPRSRKVAANVVPTGKKGAKAVAGKMARKSVAGKSSAVKSTTAAKTTQKSVTVKSVAAKTTAKTAAKSSAKSVEKPAVKKLAAKSTPAKTTVKKPKTVSAL